MMTYVYKFFLIGFRKYEPASNFRLIRFLFRGALTGRLYPNSEGDVNCGNTNSNEGMIVSVEISIEALQP